MLSHERKYCPLSKSGRYRHSAVTDVFSTAQSTRLPYVSLCYHATMKSQMREYLGVKCLLITLRNLCSLLRINGERGFLWVNRLYFWPHCTHHGTKVIKYSCNISPSGIGVGISLVLLPCGLTTSIHPSGMLQLSISHVFLLRYITDSITRDILHSPRYHDNWLYIETCLM